MIRSIWNTVCSLFGGCRRAFDRLMRVLHIVILMMVIHTVNLVMESGLKGDVSVWDIDPETKERVLFKISGEKTLPPNLNMNMLSIHFDNKLSRTVDYKRHVLSLGGFHFYAGGGIGQSTVHGVMDTRYHVGLSVTF